MSNEHEHHHTTAPVKKHQQSGHETNKQKEKPSHAAMGHGGHDHKKMIGDFRKRFIVSVLLTIPVVILSPMIQDWIGVDWSFSGSMYLLFAFSSAIFFYGGYPFLRGLLDEVKKLRPGMMTLIAMAISVAYFYSAAVVFGVAGMDFFWELATLIDIMLIGHWIEMKSIAGASRELELLVQLMPDVAHLIKDGSATDVKTSELKADDVILIKPGEKIPADGIIIEGESYLNESMLTGESKPVKKSKDEKVIGGSINGNGSLKVKVAHSFKDSYLSKVIRLVDDAQKAKSKTQLLADKAAMILTIVALAGGFGTLIFWLIAGKDFVFALERMVTVMVISCPHALGLAVPLVVAISTSLSAKNGLLIKNRTAFENSRKITTIIFDKTGTLTVGKFEVVRINKMDESYTEEKIMQLAASLDQNSEHPVATGIIKKAEELKVKLLPAENFESVTGRGVQATVDGLKVKVMSPGYLRDAKISFDQNLISDKAETTVFVLVNEKPVGTISLADKIRDDSAEAIQTLKQIGIKTILLTGDNETVAKSVSDALKMDGYMAEVLPHQKLDKIKDLQSKGEFVAMTGDGVNDAPALAQADVGIAVGSGSDIAAETAGIILVNSNPTDIVNLILFGKATYRKMIQNLIWATGYNVFAIPLAAGVLYSMGILLSPAFGAVLMSASTIVVAVNAQLLRKSKLSTK